MLIICGPGENVLTTYGLNIGPVWTRKKRETTSSAADQCAVREPPQIASPQTTGEQAAGNYLSVISISIPRPLIACLSSQLCPLPGTNPLQNDWGGTATNSAPGALASVWLRLIVPIGRILLSDRVD